MNQRMTSTADALGLDPKIGGHDRLVVLCLLAHAHAETGEVATAGELAGLSEIGPEDLVSGLLAGLVETGYARAEVVLTSDDAFAKLGEGAFAGTRSWAGSTHSGYRITTEGLDALDRHLSALGALPGSLKAHLLDKFFGKAAPEERPEAREKGR